MNKDYIIKAETYYKDSRSELFPFLPEKLETTLDVGCGGGRFSVALKEKYGVTELWGIEPFQKYAAEAKMQMTKVIESTIEKAISEVPDNYFDCIFFNDVLEHLLNPEDVLSSVKIKLKPKGYVFASVPNILHFETFYSIFNTGDWKYKDSGILDRTHYKFFTKKSIIRMFEESGFKINRIEGINPFYGRKLKILSFLFPKKFSHMKYIQFVVVAQIK